MQTARRHDPTKDEKFHVSIATTEEVRRKCRTPLPQLDGPQGDCPTRKRARREHRSRDGNANAVGRHDYRTLPRS
jgi:hypothetical protein